MLPRDYHRGDGHILGGWILGMDEQRWVRTKYGGGDGQAGRAGGREGQKRGIDVSSSC